MRAGIVGCGLIGIKRIKALEKDDTLVSVVDVDFNLAQKTAVEFNVRSFYEDHRVMLDRQSLDVVIVAVPDQYSFDIAMDCIKDGVSVLIEKPGAINSYQITNLIDAQEEYNATHDIPVFVKVGYNHRFNDAIAEAKKIVDNGEIGRVFRINAIYEHGGRPGYGNEWRSEIGDLLDKGCHLVDLASYFFGEKFTEVLGKSKQFRWKSRDDNSFMILETKTGRIANLTSSSTGWKNQFVFEVYGASGKIKIEGLQGSYGDPKLTLYKMVDGLEKPLTFSWDYLNGDNSWKNEWKSLKGSMMRNASLFDALCTINTLEQIGGKIDNCKKSAKN